MKKSLALQLTTVILALALIACKAQNLFSPTPTPEPTHTPLPTATATPLPTARPTDPPTPTSQPALVLLDRQTVEAGGYSFQAPQNFKAQLRASQATISNQDDSILISMAVAPRKNADQTTGSVLSGFLANVAKDKNTADFQAGQPYPAVVGGLNGSAADVSATLFGAKNSGRVTVVDTGQPGFFLAFAIVIDGPDGKRWEREGRPAFDAILNSIQFFTPLSGGACPVSSDPTYGYSKNNPIKVGGDAFDGPPRERAYLDNLAGPKGQKITYARTGSMDFGDTILDAFVISGLDKPRTLYIDEYAYTEPQAPLGFTCLAAFPLTKP